MATALRLLGHDYLVVAHVNPQASDGDIMAQSRREGRVLVTFDADFSRMIFHELQPPPAGVIYMRGRPDQARLVSEAFVAMFADGTIDAIGQFIVMDPSGGVRILPLGY